jgi:Flp pilus assembly protein TadD
VNRFLAAAAAVLLAACAAPPHAVPDAADLLASEVDAYREAVAAFRSGDPGKALQEVVPAAAREPWHVPSHMLRQDSLAALGRGAEAGAWYADEAERHPEDPARTLLAARLAPRAGGARQAGYRAALKLDPASPWTRIALAYELSRVADDEQTRATSFADRGFPADAEGARKHSKSARAEAEQLATSAAADRPDLAAVQGALADVLLDAGFGPADPRAAEARKAAEEAARIDPDSAAAWARVGRALRSSGDDEHAAAALRRAIGLSPPDPVLLANLGRVLLDLRTRDTEARDVLADAARLAPADETVAVNHAVALFRTGRFSDAAAEFARASRLAPSDPRPFEGIALTRAELGDRAGAAAAMEEYLASGGNDRDQARRFIDEMRGGAKQ